MKFSQNKREKKKTKYKRGNFASLNICASKIKYMRSYAIHCLMWHWIRLTLWRIHSKRTFQLPEHVQGNSKKKKKNPLLSRCLRWFLCVWAADQVHVWNERYLLPQLPSNKCHTHNTFTLCTHRAWYDPPDRLQFRTSFILKFGFATQKHAGETVAIFERSRQISTRFIEAFQMVLTLS